MKASEIIMGCMRWGGSWDSSPISDDDIRNTHNCIDAALESGIKLFDHADIYCMGKSEIVFGKVLQQRPELREILQIQSKAGIVMGMGPHESSHYNSSPQHLEQQLDLSLKQLQSDYLDIYIVHRPDPLTSIEESARFLKKAMEQGKIRRVGVSNMDLNQVRSFAYHLDTDLACNQIQFSLRHAALIEGIVNVDTTDYSPEQSSVSGLMQYSSSNSMPLQFWGCLDQGYYSSDGRVSDDTFSDTKALLNQLAEKYECSVSAVLLAWQMQLPVTAQPIIGTTKPERIRELAKAQTFHLSRDEWFSLWITSRGMALP